MNSVRIVLVVIVVLIAAAAIASLVIINPGLPTPPSRVSDQGVVVINMTTRSWRFDPQVVSGTDIASASSSASAGAFAETSIKVKLGSRVIIYITNLEPNQPHGFGLEEFGIPSVTNPPQQTVEVKFVADKEGTFTFFCTVFCGTGHPRHKGALIVEG